MADYKKYGSLEDFANEVWKQRSEDLPVIGLDINAITSAAMEYVGQQYAYIQLVDPNAGPEDGFTSIKVIPAKSGFTILHYGTAISSSPKDLYGISDAYQKDESGVYVPVNTGKGTRAKQIVDTAAEIVSLTQKSDNPNSVKKSWESIYIVSGQNKFCWAVWAAAQEYNLEVKGFTPSKQEIAQYERIKSEFTSIIHPQKQLTR